MRISDYAPKISSSIVPSPETILYKLCDAKKDAHLLLCMSMGWGSNVMKGKKHLSRTKLICIYDLVIFD